MAPRRGAPILGDSDDSDSFVSDSDVSDAEDALLRRRVRERFANPRAFADDAAGEVEVEVRAPRARAGRPPAARPRRTPPPRPLPPRALRGRARGALRRRLRALGRARRARTRPGRERGLGRPRAREAPRGAGRARRALHHRTLRPAVRLAPPLGPRPPPGQGVVQGHPRPRVRRVHLVSLLPPENRRSQDPMRVRGVAPRAPGRARARELVRPLPRDAHGREHRGGPGGPGVAVPGVPRHMQLQRRQLPPRQARPLPHATAHPRGVGVRVAIRRALPHRHEDPIGRQGAADPGPPRGAEGAVQAEEAEGGARGRRFRRRGN